VKTMTFFEAIEDALRQAMKKDSRIIILGEDAHSIHLNLFIEFGKKRVRPTPISESAFVGAAVGAAMAGLRPIVDVMLADFMPVAMDALVNHAAKNKAFSGGEWNVPLVIRTACGGGYGDGGQHEQSLWGWMTHIPGIHAVVPSNPADAGGLMLASLECEDPVIFFEHKLLSELWLGFMGIGGRKTVAFDSPAKGTSGRVPDKWDPVPLGKACVKRKGADITMVSLGVGVHRCLEAAAVLEREGIQAGVIDLRSVSPVDKETILEEVAASRRMLVVDEDYQHFGLSGELAAIVLEERLSFKYERVCTAQTIPYSRKMEDEVLPSTERILTAAKKILS
jgi:pyruvate/2-oxoglutarate/acetoin dehydrogenase E1 component